jgi:L-asparagine transporter-like permease
MKNEENANKNGLTARHLIMMALGTVIGGSFFLGSSIAIQSTGPSIILSYIFCGIMALSWDGSIGLEW